MEKQNLIPLFFCISVVILIFVAGIIMFLIQYRKRKIEFNSEKIIMQQQHLLDLNKATMDIQQLTMQDIGREIHDGVGQRLTLASIYSKQLANKDLPIDSQTKISEISDIINESLIQLRMLSRELADEKDHEISLSDILNNEVDKIKSLGVCNMVSDIESPISIPHKNALFIKRIVQEFFQNSLKYASCTEIKIQLLVLNNNIQLTIEDNGIGFDTNILSEGIGLQNMKQRATMIGATLQISSFVNKGTQLHLQLPI